MENPYSRVNMIENSLTKVNEIAKKERVSGRLVFMYSYIRTHGQIVIMKAEVQ
jgi:hypothetical protein